MPSVPPDAVFLIHGTFASCDEDLDADDPASPGAKRAWWQEGSEFAVEMDRHFAGFARCWPPDVCDAMPWARPGLVHRLKAWTIAGRQPFRWLRTRRRRTFGWSGTNSESERRKAGRRLFEGLVGLERENRKRVVTGEPPQPYHLIGHSHGGSVIWNALRLAAGRGESLPHLRTWTTLGTPFPTFRPIRRRWLVGLLGILALVATFQGILWAEGSGGIRLPSWRAAVETIDAFFSWRSPANLYPFGLSPATTALVTVLLALGAWFAFAIVTWAYRWWECRADDRDSDRAWRRFGRKWLGLFSKLDEAIAGTQNTVGLYASNLFRFAWPGPPPLPRPDRPLGLPLYVLVRMPVWLLAWFVVPLMNGVVLPLAEWVLSLVFLLKFQGSDRLGAYLTLMSPEPFSRATFPDERGRGPLPRDLARPLQALARRKVEASILGVRRGFARDARGPRSPKDLLRSYFSEINITNELIHNSYYDLDTLRRAVACHILGSSPDHISRDGLFPEGSRARAWVEGRSPRPSPRRYLPATKPPAATPARTRCLLAALFLFLCGFAGWSVASDLEKVYIARLATRIADAREGAVDRGLVRAFEMFRGPSERRLAESIASSDGGGRRKMLEFLKGRRSLSPSTIEQIVGIAFDETAERSLRIGALETLLGPENCAVAADRIVARIRRLDDEFPRSPVGSTTNRGFDAPFETLVAIGPDSVPALRLALEGGTWNMRRDAIWGLGRIGPAARPALPKLVPILGDGGLGSDVSQALVAIGSDSINALAATSDPLDVASALGRCGVLGDLNSPDPKAVAMLTTLLDHPEVNVRLRASIALGKLGEPGLSGMKVALRNEKVIVRIPAVEWSAKLPPSAVPVTALAEALDRGFTSPIMTPSGLENYFEAICQALVAAGEPAVPHLSALLAREDRFSISSSLSALRALGPRAAGSEDALVSLIERMDDRRRKGNERSEDEEDFRRALVVLGQIGPAASPVIGRLFARLGKETPTAQRRLTVETIGEIGVRQDGVLNRLLAEVGRDADALARMRIHFDPGFMRGRSG